MDYLKSLLLEKNESLSDILLTWSTFSNASIKSNDILKLLKQKQNGNNVNMTKQILRNESEINNYTVNKNSVDKPSSNTIIQNIEPVSTQGVVTLHNSSDLESNTKSRHKSNDLKLSTKGNSYNEKITTIFDVDEFSEEDDDN